MKNSLLFTTLLGLSSLASAAVTETPANPLAEYEATEISQSTARRIFADMKNGSGSKSICANRSMTWAYEAKKNYNVDSEKIFIHYTDVFNHVIDNDAEELKCFFGFCPGAEGWEYHVASIFNVDGKKQAFDKHFIKSGPVSPGEWTKIFSNRGEKKLNSKASKLIARLKKNVKKLKKKNRKGKNDAKILKNESALKLMKNSYNSSTGRYEIKCKEITNIAEHDLDQMNSWCHTQKTSMYYFTQHSLRLLNNNSKSIINSGNYTDRNIINGANYYQSNSFNEDVIEYARDQGFSSSEVEAMGYDD